MALENQLLHKIITAHNTVVFIVLAKVFEMEIWNFFRHSGECCDILVFKK
jgi:hypothetical protein